MRTTARLLHVLPATTALGVAFVFASHEVHARPSSLEDDVTKRLEYMQAELERLRHDNEAMRAELDEVRARTADNWLTDQRAKEIRAIVHDVLADADTRTSLLRDGLTAGWSDGFFIADPHGRFRLQIGGQIQFRWMYNFHDDHDATPEPTFFPDDQDRHRSGFELARTRLTFRGHLFGPELTYLVRGDFQRHRLQRVPGVLLVQTTDNHGGYFHLLDGWMRFHLTDEWSFRVGQFKLPFTRESLVSSAHQLAVERSVIDSRLGIGRSLGVDLTWADGPHRLTVAVSDGGASAIGGANPLVGGGDGNPMNTGAVAPNVEYAITGRYDLLVAGTWQQFEDFRSTPEDPFGLLVGAAVHYQRSEAANLHPTAPGGQVVEHPWFGLTLDASVEWGGANLFGSFTYHRFDDRFGAAHSTWGLVVQGGFYVAPEWELFARWEYGDWDVRDDLGFTDFYGHLERDLHIITVGLNYYLFHHDVKWTTDLGVALTRVSHAWGWNPAGVTGWRAAAGGSPTQVLFRTQLQLMF